MIDKIIAFSIKNKLVVALFVVALAIWGIFSFKQIPIDAVPDITTNQVQVITQSPKLAAQEVEQFVTFPIELSLANLPGVTEIRSISRFGISVITVVFEENVDIYLARQLISEQLKVAEKEIPMGFGSPELGPISTGLGEVYQYILHTEPGYDSVYSDMDLRTINDWIVKRQLAGTPGVIEVSGWGGHLKQYQVAINPTVLNNMHISIADVFEAIERNNENTGGSYIERRYNTYFIRGEGLVKSLEDIEDIVVRVQDGIPLLVRDIAEVNYGSAPRYGAITWNGKGEVVGGQTLMLKGENSYEVVNDVKERIEVIRKSLPEGVVLEEFIDRSELIGRAFGTVRENLILGGLIVIFVLIILLGNIRGGLIVASTIPLSMLVALGLMNFFGVSANLMSLGALDFGIIVDGAVIIVESVVFYLSSHYVAGKVLSQKERDNIAQRSSSKMMQSAFFGQLIILIVFIPILTLTGIEGKMFRPMAQTVSFAMIGAIILSLTYVPMMSSVFLRVRKRDKMTFSDRIVNLLNKAFDPFIRAALHFRWITISIAAVILLIAGFLYSRLGGEFIPTLEEGNLAIHQILPPGSSLQQSVEVSEKIQKLLLEEFPEVQKVVSKIGTGEVPTDPMPIEVGDIMVNLAPKNTWVSASSKEEMFEKMEEVLTTIPGVQYEFSQPIQMRFNELIAGIREDLAVKIFGENPDVLFQKANEAEQLLKDIPGVGDIKVEQTQGLPQMIVRYERDKLAQYGLDIKALNQALRTAFAGEKAGVVFEGEKRFDLVVRLGEPYRRNLDDIRNLFVPLPNGNQIPMKEVAEIKFEDGPMQISRENTKRRITVGINARGRDIESLFDEVSSTLEDNLELPPGYYIDYGGTFENLTQAKRRLAIAVPVALALIFALVFLALQSFKQTLMIYMSIPLAAVGGILLLWLRDMPFSISAGVGFIVLSGVAVLNGLVLISSLNTLKEEGTTDFRELIIKGTKRRIRPILLTASTDILGFLPMAISTSAGAEVQRPLATVVIGGLITATLLTLIILPVLYSLFHNVKYTFGFSRTAKMLFFIPVLAFLPIHAFSQEMEWDTDTLTLSGAIMVAQQNHPAIRAASIDVDKQEYLKKTGFDPDFAKLMFSLGKVDADKTEYEWSVSQNFAFPSVYTARSDLLEKNIALSRQGVAVELHRLEWQVRKAWWQLTHAAERERVLTEIAGRYADFAHFAERKFTAGESNILEKTRAESQFKQVQLKALQAASDVRIQTRHLQQLMGTDTAFSLPPGAFVRLDIPPHVVSKSVENPVEDYFQRKIDVAEQTVRLEKRKHLPDLSIGYFDNNLDGFRGVQLGIGIPIFYRAQQARVDAAKIERKRMEALLDRNKLEIEGYYNAATESYTRYSEELRWYETHGLKTADELIRTAFRAYKAGEADYAEYIQALDQAVEIRLAYLDVLKAYNLSVTDLQYYFGTFE